MTVPRTYGHRASGEPITDADIDDMADQAEAGFDVDDLIARRNKRGRPPIGDGPATVESVRLDPALREQLSARAATDNTSVSEVIREALRQFLQAS